MATTLFSLLVSAALIVASPVPAGGPTGPCQGDIYRSQPNDTCEIIGKKYDAPASVVKLFNEFVNCDDIWTGTPICLDFARPAPAVPSTCDEYYISQPGDTCASIASSYGVTVESVKLFNDWVNCNDIWPNTRICAQFHVRPNPETKPPTACEEYYISRPGDTCQSIANLYGVTVDSVKLFNDWVNCDDIWPNTRICAQFHVRNSPEATPPSIPEPPTCTRSYVAKAGDTCTNIARGNRFYAKMIYDANASWMDCNDIRAGTTLCLGSQLGALIDGLPAYNPPRCASTYITRAGDTCKNIARGHRGLGEADIRKFNESIDCNNILAGTEICMPEYTTISNCLTIITARAGQSCNSLTQAWKVSVEQFKSVNVGLDCGASNDGSSNLVQDQEICIPWSLHL